MALEAASCPITWSRMVKQSPKNVMFSSSSVGVSSGLSTNNKELTHQTQRTAENVSSLPVKHELEGLVEKKKKKKKKKKSSTNCDGQDNDKLESKNLVQEPPKFQDDEEFPDLSVSMCALEKGIRNHKSNVYSQTSKKEKPAVSKKSGKKSKVPVQLDLGGMLSALEGKQNTDKAKMTKPLVLTVGSAAPVVTREPPTASKQIKQGRTPHNPLDSSAPLVKKGKQREVPKAKKPTSLKKIILKEREERKQHQPSGSELPSSLSGYFVSVEGDFALESTNLSETAVSPNSPVDTQENADNSQELEASIILSGQPTTERIEMCPSQSVPALPKVHSRRFREYCSQVLRKEVDNCATELLKELVRFQDRQYKKDPEKAKSKRRLVMGLREVLKHLKLRKLKCIIISPNCEKIQAKGGLDDTLQTIISCACEQNVPFVFALNRKALGRCLNKAVPVSVVGIFSYDGAQDHFHKLYELTMQARQDYKEMIVALEEKHSESDDRENEIVSVTKNVQSKPGDTSSTLASSDADEPNYIKVWRKMLEEDYTPYALSLEGKVTTDLFNLQL
ncbi:hypothetical protein GDO86_001524 [Hymenochirus boettgeri]|uniref:Ribosomal protein eL8/eL30/eS12/Gadd45 domain-containing protein n=1 Tax=Hymenochirus boettgeri TaxID=247094 RepID=A0A8T2KHG0_9PIPI|nr:hypothetical protein GDO86_001524 [Hymenochirus boettgeri]